MNALEWLARHRLRRNFRRAYVSQLKRLDTTFAWLTTAHPEWPTKKTAKQVMRQADAALDLNRTLHASGVGEGTQLEHDVERITQIRATAERLAGTGEDGGSAGVREPRRPLPHAGGPGSAVHPPEGL